MRNDLEISKFIATVNSLIENLNIQITYQTDFHLFKELRSKVRPNHPYFPAFNPDEVAIENDTASWLHGAHGGETVLLQAMKLLDLGGGSLADHLSLHRREYALPGGEVDLKESVVTESPTAQEITGRVCYHGEFWLDRRFRGGGITGVMPRMMLLLAHLAWRPDYIFGLQSLAYSYRGLGIKEGYAHTEMRGVCWQLKNGTRLHEAIVWMSHNDLLRLLRHAPEDVFSEIEGLRRPADNGAVVNLFSR